MSLPSNTVSQSTIASALAVIFQPMVVSQMNRSVVLLQLLPYMQGSGQNLTWDINYGDAAPADSTLAEGEDVATYNNDTLAPAVLNWGSYSEAVVLTGKALSVAQSTANPRALEDLFGFKFENAINRLTKSIGQDIYTGSGATNYIHGLTATNGGLKATGTYATIVRGSVAQFAGNELLNGAIDRPLTQTLMFDTKRAIYDACGEEIDLIVCDSYQHEQYALSLGSNRRYNQEITLRGQKIVLDGGYSALDFCGVPVIKDINCPAGMMLFLNSRHVKMCQLASGPNSVNRSSGEVALRGTPEDQFGQMATQLTARINPLAINGDRFGFQMVLYPQLMVTRPNSCGILGDLVTA